MRKNVFMYVPSQPFPSCGTRAVKSGGGEEDPALLPRSGTPTFGQCSSLRLTLAKIRQRVLYWGIHCVVAYSPNYPRA